jgi:hypothetical protein
MSLRLIWRWFTLASATLIERSNILQKPVKIARFGSSTFSGLHHCSRVVVPIRGTKRY